MSGLVLIFFYFFFMSEILWYFTCTKHKDVPLIYALITVLLGWIPGLNIIISLIVLFLMAWLADNGIIELKNNWFNRVFLAYNE